MMVAVDGLTNNTSFTDLMIFAGMLLGFYSLLRVIIAQWNKDRIADRVERKALAAAIKRMASSSDKVASATVRGADEAKQRNGHLAELVLESSKANAKLAQTATDTILSAVQNVQEMKVEHQTIKESKTIKKEPKK